MPPAQKPAADPDTVLQRDPAPGTTTPRLVYADWLDGGTSSATSGPELIRLVVLAAGVALRRPAPASQTVRFLAAGSSGFLQFAKAWSVWTGNSAGSDGRR